MVVPLPAPYVVPISANNRAYVVRLIAAPLQYKNPSGNDEVTFMMMVPVGIKENDELVGIIMSGAFKYIDVPASILMPPFIPLKLTSPVVDVMFVSELLVVLNVDADVTLTLPPSIAFIP